MKLDLNGKCGCFVLFFPLFPGKKVYVYAMICKCTSCLNLVFPFTLLLASLISYCKQRHIDPMVDLTSTRRWGLKKKSNMSITGKHIYLNSVLQKYPDLFNFPPLFTNYNLFWMYFINIIKMQVSGKKGTYVQNLSWAKIHKVRQKLLFRSPFTLLSLNKILALSPAQNFCFCKDIEQYKGRHGMFFIEK